MLQVSAAGLRLITRLTARVVRNNTILTVLFVTQALTQYSLRETNRDIYQMEITFEATKPQDPIWRHTVRLNNTNFGQIFSFDVSQSDGLTTHGSALM